MKDLYIKKTKKDLDNIYEIEYELKYKDVVIAYTKCKVTKEPLIPEYSPTDDEIDEWNRKKLLAGIKIIEE